MAGLFSADVSPAQLLFLLASSLAAGLARGFSGFGSALVFVPLASAAIGPQVAVPLLVVVDGFMTAGLIPAAFRLAEFGRIGGQKEETGSGQQAGEDAPEQRPAAERFLRRLGCLHAHAQASRKANRS